MKHASISFVLLVLALGLFLAGCGGGSQDVPATAVAVVDGTEIARSDLDELLELAKASYGSSYPKVGTPEYQSLQQQIVASLVERVQFEKEAEKLGIAVSDKDIETARKELIESRYSGDEKKLVADLKDQGVSDELFLKLLRAGVISTKLFDSATKDVEVTDTEALAYYTQNQDQYKTTTPSRLVRHILIGEQVDPSCTPGSTSTCAIDYEKSKAEADRIHAELKGGADFAALAKKYSDDSGSKDSGGKYCAIKGQSVPEFDKLAFELKTNEISEPVRTQFGYHVIQALADATPAGVTPFECATALITQTLLQNKRNEAMAAWVEDLQKRYKGKVSYAAGLAPPELPDTTTETQ